MKKFFNCRQHPVRILGYTTKTFWLLLIPLARSLIAINDVKAWIEGWWLDMIVLGVMFAYAFLRWFFVTFTIENGEISANTGLFGISRVKIPLKNVCTVSVSQGAFYRALRAYSLYIDTNSGAKRRSDLTLAVNFSQIEGLKEILTKEGAKPSFSYSPRKRNLVIFSLLFSSTLSGLILFSTLIIQSSRIVGRELEERFFNTLNSYAMHLAIKLPRYVIIFACVVIFGWLYSFLLNLFRHFNFTVSRTGKYLFIQSGVVTKRYHRLTIDRINYIDIRQSLLMKLFKICSVHIHCAGYGKSSREIAVLIPVTTLRVVEKTMGLLLPETKHVSVTLRPRKKNIMRYLWPPIILCTALPVSAAVLIYFFKGWSEIIRFVAIMLEIPSVWLLIVKAYSIVTTGVGCEDGYLVLSYCRFYQFHQVIVKTENITKVKMYQTPFQYLRRNVSFVINIHGESNTYHRIKNFPLTPAQRFAANLRRQ